MGEEHQNQPTCFIFIDWVARKNVGVPRKKPKPFETEMLCEFVSSLIPTPDAVLQAIGKSSMCTPTQCFQDAFIDTTAAEATQSNQSEFGTFYMVQACMLAVAVAMQIQAHMRRRTRIAKT